jgi:ABC-type multidrug transport system ATPase subunit
VSPSSAAICTHGLTKRYREVTAVDGLHLDVRQGEIYGFLGRNGAGKTTTIRMLLGLIGPTSGTVELFGRPVRAGTTALFARVGYLVETATAYGNLTARENLDMQRRLTGAPRAAVAAVITLLRLEEHADRRAAVLSLGNKQRLSLARALLHHPDLLILDEPANALDPAGIVEIRELLRSLARERGVTIFISSHILTEVAQLADRVGIVHEGRLLEEIDRDRPAAKGPVPVEIRLAKPQRAAALLAKAGFTGIERTDSGLRVMGALGRIPDIARVLLEAGLDFTGIAAVEEDLESHFLRLTGGVQ